MDCRYLDLEGAWLVQPTRRAWSRTCPHLSHNPLPKHPGKVEGGRLAGAWGSRRDDAKLLQHPQPVKARPTFNPFSVGVEAPDIDPGHAEPFTRGGHEGFQMVEVRPALGAGHRATCHDLVTCGELILDGDPDVRECRSGQLDMPFHALPTGWRAGGQKMYHEAGRRKFVEDGEVALVPRLFNDLAKIGIVLFG